MKIMVLADSNSAHTIKWITSLADQGIDIILAGFDSCHVRNYAKYKNIQTYSLCLINKCKKGIAKLNYFRGFETAQQLIKKFQPDILHAHYASSYGFIGSLLNFHPYIVSVWGSDIYIFPRKSFIHKQIITFVFSKADMILSTSKAMAVESQKYTKKKIFVTPFGIDTSVFKPMKVDSIFDSSDFVVGTIKSLETIYGVEYLIKAFKLLKDRCPDKQLKLLIVGGGSLEKSLKKLAQQLDIFDHVIFTGKIPYEKIPIYHNMISVFVAVSNSESFGVSVLEAQSCEIPVIVSDVGGLPEIVENGVTGFIIPPKNSLLLADCLEKLLLNPELRKTMGTAARRRIELYYRWDTSVKQMMDLYTAIVKT